MRTTHRRRGAPEGEEEEVEEDVGYINPMAQPPAVGLTLGKGGTLPKFLFHTQLPTSKVNNHNVALFFVFFVCVLLIIIYS